MSWKDSTKKSGHVPCVVVDEDYLSSHRIVLVDIIDVNKYGVTKTILMPRELCRGVWLFEAKPQFSHTWVRFEDARHDIS